MNDVRPQEDALQALSNEVALLSDPDGTLRWVDARAERVLSVHAGDSFLDLVAPGTHDKARLLLESASRAPTTEVWELFLEIRQTPTVMAWRGAPEAGGALLVGSLLPQHYSQLHDQLTEILGDLAVLQRETERHRRRLSTAQAQNDSLLAAERSARALVEAERLRLQQVLDRLPEGIVIADAEGRYAVANAAATEMMGLELTGQPMPATDAPAFGARDLHGSAIPARQLPVHRSALQGEIIRGEQLIVRNAADGRDVPLLVNSVPLYGPDGQRAGAVAVFQDISAIKQLEDEKDHFLATVSHDLRNPLAGIKGWIQILRRRARRLPDDQREQWQRDLGTVETAANRMGAIIDELTDLTHLHMGRRLELHREPVNLLDLTTRVLAENQQLAQKHTLRVEAPDMEIVGFWDSTRIGRVIGNLVSNAVKYSPEGGEITIELIRELADQMEWATLSVQDQGIGIPEQDLPRVFDRFFRARNAADFAGTGIGLAGAQQLVEQHGGTISVRSQAGMGSTFTVRLPLADEARA